MPAKKAKKDEVNILPGFEELVAQEQEQWFFEGDKNGRYFDAAELPDAPGRQLSGLVQTHAIYLLFPTKADMIRATNALTRGARKGVAGKTRIVSINSIAEVPGLGITFLEMWEQYMLEQNPYEEDGDSDEAQAPI